MLRKIRLLIFSPAYSHASRFHYSAWRDASLAACAMAHHAGMGVTASAFDYRDMITVY